VSRALAIGCVVLALGLALTGTLLKKAWSANGALETKLASAQAVIDQREKDIRENAKAVAQLAQKLSDTESKVVTVTEKIYAAPRTTACPDQPAIRAAIGSLPDLYANPVPAGDRRQPQVALPAARAAGRADNR
jgi:septal ring factor EnvC (AmiA/AmiB activator)